MREIAERLIDIPGVAAGTLGVSQAGGLVHADSGWDLCLYYRGELRADDVRALGLKGTVVEPGDGGPLAASRARG